MSSNNMVCREYVLRSGRGARIVEIFTFLLEINRHVNLHLSTLKVILRWPSSKIRSRRIFEEFDGQKLGSTFRLYKREHA